jgi:hypothetical protein
MRKSKTTKYSIHKVHMNVAFYKKPVQNSLELRISADQKVPSEVKDVTHLYKNVKLKLRG